MQTDKFKEAEKIQYKIRLCKENIQRVNTILAGNITGCQIHALGAGRFKHGTQYTSSNINAIEVLLNADLKWLHEQLGIYTKLFNEL